jgi:hypothetical protein
MNSNKKSQINKNNNIGKNEELNNVTFVEIYIKVLILFPKLKFNNFFINDI